jgi:choline dehydrogenase-like flavoprotein
MSDSAETGVVDKNLKAHGYSNFYITDGSIIQGNIGVNPSLTIAAMSEYTMSNIPSTVGKQQTDISNQLILLENEWKKKKSV